jgi:hypothetical protein
MGHEFTREESQKGAQRAAEVKRERRRAFEERLSAKLDEKLERIMDVLDEALDAELLIVAGPGNIVASPAHGTRLRAAFAFMHEVYGRPTQRLELTGEDGGPVELEHRGVSVHDVFAVLRDAGVLSAEGNGS